MSGALRRFAASAPLMMPAALAVGLAAPDATAALRPWVAPLSVALVVLSMLRVEPARLRAAFDRPGHVAAVCAAMLIAAPALAAGIAFALGAPSWLAAGLALCAAAPPLSSSAAFAIIVRIDPAYVTALSIPATLIAPATVWAVTALLPGMEQGVDVTALSLRLAGLIFAAFGLALLARRVLGAARVNRAAAPLDAAAVALMALIGFAITEDIRAPILSDLSGWLAILAATWALSAGACLGAALLFRGAGRDRSAAAGLACAVRNMALMVAAVTGAVEDRIALVVVTAQIPIYAAPLLMRPLFARLGRERGTA
ncbi:hypothetical protein SAMN05444336_10581 [Albimonas donghaensis]|uniref:Bile acid:Na+ symporter, BASS family n=1 Tax=Albimonas donghaensis TaxID=356660 RepID=A0A1H3BP45_9RHOB|nr:hypothetical protein [Albimonas donghaensis]SDX42919.1 hypothetical protein SAMN05444336_10581 [Albimonas donghaensis]